MLGDSMVISPHRSYSSNLFELNFFSILSDVSRRMSIFLSIPETFIIGFGFEKPTLICSDRKTKELIFEENLSSTGIQEGFRYFKEISVNNSPIAIFKSQNNLHDKCRVLNSVSECINIWEKHFRQGQAVVIQRFVYSGKIPKVFKSFYCLDQIVQHKLSFVKKKKSNFSGNNQIFPGIQRNCTLKVFEDRNWIIRQKDHDDAKDVPVEFSIKSQVSHLALIVEKFYSSSKNCRLDKIKTVWVMDKLECFYLVNVKSFRVLNIVFRPIQMKKRASKNNSFDIQGPYRVIKRTKKSLERIVRFRTANERSRSQKMLGGGK
jgi:hypothetical protein